MLPTTRTPPLNPLEICSKNGTPIFAIVENISKKASSLDIEGAFFQGNKIADLIKLNKDALINSVVSLIAWLRNMQNLKIPLNDEQARFISGTIIKRYAHLNLEEFIFICNNIVLGRYGKNFESYDPSKFFEVVDYYIDKHREDLLLKKDKEALKTPAIEKDSSPPPKKDIYKDWLDKTGQGFETSLQQQKYEQKRKELVRSFRYHMPKRPLDYYEPKEFYDKITSFIESEKHLVEQLSDQEQLIFLILERFGVHIEILLTEK